MHWYSLFFLFIVIGSSTGGSLREKLNARIRREKSEFAKTTCVLISSAAKERCEIRSSTHNEGDAIQSQSCVTDEKFRVKYGIQTGQIITSTIETYGHKFPRLMEVGRTRPFF